MIPKRRAVLIVHDHSSPENKMDSDPLKMIASDLFRAKSLEDIHAALQDLVAFIETRDEEQDKSGG